jgi:hypothetical protein
MTRQLIICSALVASVTGPALAVSNVAGGAALTAPALRVRITGAALTAPALRIRLSDPAKENRLTDPAAAHSAQVQREVISIDPCRASSVEACHARNSNLAGLFTVTKDLEKVTNPAQWLKRRIPVDMLRQADPIVIRQPFTNPVQGRLRGIVCSSDAAGRPVGLGACGPLPIVGGVKPLFVDDAKLHRTCVAMPCFHLPIVFKDPSIWGRGIEGQARALNLHKVTIRRQPAQYHTYNVLLHLGSTPFVTGGIDNQ